MRFKIAAKIWFNVFLFTKMSYNIIILALKNWKISLGITAGIYVYNMF